MKMLNKIDSNVDPWEKLWIILAILLGNNLLLLAVFFLITNFVSILDHPNLVRKLLI